MKMLANVIWKWVDRTLDKQEKNYLVAEIVIKVEQKEVITSEWPNEIDFKNCR